MSDEITKTFTITTDSVIMKRFERFLALLHFNSNYGHSGIFAMPLDGDGHDKFQVKEMENNRLDYGSIAREVDLLSGIGYHCEIAKEDCYYGKDFVSKPSRWIVTPGAVLLKENEKDELVIEKSLSIHRREL